MMIVSDVNDVFVPLLDGFLVDAKDSKTVIERYEKRILAIFLINIHKPGTYRK